MEKWKIENSHIALNLTFNITTTLPQSNIHIQHYHHPPQPNIHIQHYPFPRMAVNAWQGIEPKPDKAFLAARPDSRVRLSDKTNVPGIKWHPHEKESDKTPCDINSKFNIQHSTLTKRNKVSFRHIYFLIAFFEPRVDVLSDIYPRLSGLRPCKPFRLDALPFRHRSPGLPPDLTRCLSGTAHPASSGEMENGKWKMEISPIALNLTFNITTTLPQSNIHIQHYHYPPPTQHSHSTLPPPSPTQHSHSTLPIPPDGGQCLTRH